MTEQVKPNAQTMVSVSARCLHEQPQGMPEINADQLFSASNTLAIKHAGEVYLLKRTKLNKLLLTKQSDSPAMLSNTQRPNREG